MASPSVLGAMLLIIVCLHLTAALQRNRATGLRSDLTSNSGGRPSIANRPWHVYARFQHKICSGIILHANWVMLLEACTIDSGIKAESQIQVNAGVHETSGEAEQVVMARVHPTRDVPLEGVTILHLETALLFDDNVQPARFPNTVHWTVDGYDGVAAGFSTNGSGGIRLQAFSAKLYTLNAEKRLFARGNSDWPTENNHTRGTDYLEMVDDRFKVYCMVGARKPNIENSQLVEYYPTDRMMVWFAENLGLTVQPSSGIGCVHLVN